MIGGTKVTIILQMKVFEILKFNREMLERLRLTGIRLDDTQYIDLYSDYVSMVKAGLKKTYIKAVLANKYGVCERTICTVVKRLGAECGNKVIGGGKN